MAKSRKNSLCSSIFGFVCAFDLFHFTIHSIDEFLLRNTYKAIDLFFAINDEKCVSKIVLVFHKKKDKCVDRVSSLLFSIEVSV